MNKSAAFILRLAASLLVCAACTMSPPTPTPTSTPLPSPTPTPDISRFVDFTLPRVGGGTLTFSELHGERPLVVVFYRGLFCTICRIQMRELQEAYPQFQSHGAEVIAISTDAQADAYELVATLGLEFPVLYDPDAEAARAWRIFNLLGDGLAAPATFVFNGAGDLMAQHIGTDAGDRPTASETLEVVRQSTQGGVA